MSTPQTRIFICQSLGLSNDYKHTFYFDNPTEQTTFFGERVLKTFVDYAYVRKNWSLKVKASITEAEKWGYLFFQNFSTGKHYYYFITNVKYISDETVELELEMDVMQTYFFDYALQPSFVEREHASTDVVGDNTLDEELELGHLITDGTFSPDLFNGKMSVLLMSTVNLMQSDYPTATGRFADGVYSGCYIYRVLADGATGKIAQILGELGAKADSIIGMWMYPEGLIQVGGLLEGDDPTLNIVLEAKSDGVTFTGINRPTEFAGYTPKNNKLLTYPYVHLYLTNNAGNSAIYRYERFLDGEVLFQLDGSIYPDGGVKCTPRNYNGVGFNYDESLTLTGFPTCAWNADTYKIWLAQNQNQQTGQILLGAGAMAGGLAMLATGNVIGGVGAIAGGATGIFSLVSQRSDMEKQPPQARGQVSATLNASINQHRITAYRKQITRERAEIIDNYFTMFGYKTLRVKTPNRNVRESFTFTKTQGCLITGSMCQEDVRKIQKVYDNGVTFWQKNVSIGNYSAPNAVK